MTVQKLGFPGTITKLEEATFILDMNLHGEGALDGVGYFMLNLVFLH